MENKQEAEKMKFTAARCGVSKRNCDEAAPVFAKKSIKAIHFP
jgi:hypothetical protein